MKIPRYIDADVMREEWLQNGENEYVYDTNAVLESIDSQPTVDVVHVVRHGETTSFVTTDDIDKYNSRIVLDEGQKSKFCRIFYEDDREHGMWQIEHTNEDYDRCVCSVCNGLLLIRWKDQLSHYQYCPNCGAKMDGGANIENA